MCACVRRLFENEMSLQLTYLWQPVLRSVQLVEEQEEMCCVCRGVFRKIVCVCVVCEKIAELLT